MLIEAQALEKRYGAFTALRGVNLTLDHGEVVGFLGPNGAGKSTTMKILTGAVAPTAGRATINGNDLAADPLACRRSIGYLPQEPPLYPEMTVRGYLDHVARLKGIQRGTRNHEVMKAMERCGLLAVAKRHLHKLSGGNRQRVGLAQALLGSPPILILDEATAGLDPTQVARFRDLVRSLGQAHGILLSTHILAEVEACCTRVVVVDRGQDILHASVAELRERARSQSRVRVRLESGDGSALAGALAQQPWASAITVDDDCVLCQVASGERKALVKLAMELGGLRELSEERRSLEEVFADIIETAPQSQPAPQPAP